MWEVCFPSGPARETEAVWERRGHVTEPTFLENDRSQDRGVDGRITLQEISMKYNTKFSAPGS